MTSLSAGLSMTWPATLQPMRCEYQQQDRRFQRTLIEALQKRLLVLCSAPTHSSLCSDLRTPTYGGAGGCQRQHLGVNVCFKLCAGCCGYPPSSWREQWAATTPSSRFDGTSQAYRNCSFRNPTTRLGESKPCTTSWLNGC